MIDQTQENLVTIPIKEYDALLSASAVLAALHEYGVDNWDGYWDAMGSLDEDD